jgi:hypothetical protein
MMPDGWLPIKSAPKDGTLIQGKEEDLSKPRVAFYNCYWKRGKWTELHLGGTVHPTEWRHNSAKVRSQL